MTACPETWIPCSNCGRYFDPEERNLKWTTRSTDEEFTLNRICGGCTDIFFTAMRAYREVLREKGEMR